MFLLQWHIVNRHLAPTPILNTIVAAWLAEAKSAKGQGVLREAWLRSVACLRFLGVSLLTTQTHKWTIRSELNLV